MTRFAPFTVLRQQIREAKEKGDLVPSADAARKQFEALVMNEVSPMLQHLSSILCQEGVPASVNMDLDHRPAYAELHLEEAGVQFFIVDMLDCAQIRVDLHVRGETEPSQTTLIPMCGQMRERLSFLLEQMLINTLVVPQHFAPLTSQEPAASSQRQ